MLLPHSGIKRKTLAFLTATCPPLAALQALAGGCKTQGDPPGIAKLQPRLAGAGG
jgi:hypothetical protein